MVVETKYADEALLVCPHERCERKVVVRADRIVVLDQGDFSARHVGSTGGLAPGLPAAVRLG
jgi:hypothetical protein